MPAYCKRPPDTVVLTFERIGAPPVRLDAVERDKAVLRAVALLLMHRKLQPGDRLTVEAAG